MTCSNSIVNFTSFLGQHPKISPCLQLAYNILYDNALDSIPLGNIYIYLLTFVSTGPLLLCAGFLQLQQEGGYSSSLRMGFLLQWLLLLQSTGSRHGL